MLCMLTSTLKIVSPKMLITMKVIIDFDDNDNLTISQIYVDKKLSNSQSSIGIITARYENDFIKLQIENNVGNVH